MINSLTLTDFRNHEHFRINTNGCRNIAITGPNGSGKTAVLEALSMLGGNSGFRGAPICDMARFGSSGFSVFAALTDDTEISVSWNSGDANRRARIAGDSAPLSELAAHLRIVWLTPREDRLFVDSTSDRRNFFDRLVAGFDPAHSGRVARLSKLLSERAFALKNGAADAWLAPIESQIAGTAVAVACARVRYAAEINYFLEDAAISVNGMLEEMQTPAADIEREYANYLAANRELIADKMNIAGAHKSDFAVFSQVHNLPASFLSTGQQKSVLLKLILAHAKLIRARAGKSAIVLIDEADAHLDAVARQKFFDELAATDAQVFATGIDAENFAGIDNAVFVRLEL
ncbi:MAG: DNA replication and repair protein RecF [Rickettsiales bacterium]|nr:DNA replication and repair protein RecF [Rickettsiales bacterium]